jgi:transposase
MRIEYPRGFKARMVQRLTGPDAVSAKSLSEELGIATSTLCSWKAQAVTLVSMKKGTTHPQSSPEARSAEEKMRLVLESSRLSDDKLGAFLRQEGIHESHLISWKQSMLESLLEPVKVAPKSKKNSSEAKKVKALEKELRRKDKALAETAALLVLKKKVDALWGDEDDDI